jgi:hypothetical protein
MVETGAFERHLRVVLADPTRVAKHVVHAGGARGDDIGIEHHERQTAIALKRMLVVVVDYRLLFPIENPPIAGYPPIVLVDLAVSLAPVIELAGADADPGYKLIEGVLDLD